MQQFFKKVGFVGADGAPTEIYKQFQPATVELSRLLTAALGKPANVELRITKTYEECLDEFVAGKIDIVRLGPRRTCSRSNAATRSSCWPLSTRTRGAWA